MNLLLHHNHYFVKYIKACDTKHFHTDARSLAELFDVAKVAIIGIFLVFYFSHTVQAKLNVVGLSYADFQYYYLASTLYLDLHLVDQGCYVQMRVAYWK